MTRPIFTTRCALVAVSLPLAGRGLQAPLPSGGRGWARGACATKSGMHENRKPGPPRPGRAFSLLEILIAIGILAVGLVAVASIFPVSVIQQKRAIDESMGVVVANNVLAALQGIGKGAFPPAATTGYEEPLSSSLVYDPLIYQDPGELYNYKILYRRPQLDGPVEVVVFAYRRDSDTTTDTTQGAADTVRLWTSDANIETNGHMTNDGSTAASRNQLIFAFNNNNGFVLNIVKKGEVGNPPKEETTDYYCLFVDNDGDGNVSTGDTMVRANAIVTGTVR